MKTKVSIYKGNELIAESICKTKKEVDLFINSNLPKMTIITYVKEGWRIFRSFK